MHRANSRQRLTVAVAVLGVTSCLYPPDPPRSNLDAAADGTVDGTALPTIPVLNGCTMDLYVDASNPMSNREVDFGGIGESPGFGYSPACMIVGVGQSVTWSGPFDLHPLSPGSAPSLMMAGSPDNPIQRVSTGSNATVAFPTPGVYPYFCEQHYAGGMSGVIWVR